VMLMMLLGLQLAASGKSGIGAQNGG